MLPRGGPLGSDDRHVITINIIIIIILSVEGGGVVSYLQAGEGCCLLSAPDNPPLDVLISSGELDLLKTVNSRYDGIISGQTTSTVVREVWTLKLKISHSVRWCWSATVQTSYN